MFFNKSLSFEAAPPISVVFRYFLSASIFGIALSFFLFFQGKELLSNPLDKLIATHLFTIGIMASFMAGALFQILPVVCGVSINNPTKLAMRIHYAFIVGLLFLLYAFKSGSNFAFLAAALFLGGALLTLAAIFLYKLTFIHFNNASRGVFFALVTLLIALFFALYMIFEQTSILESLDYLSLKSIHIAFALYGWIFLLISSVSFQVIEMFYVTPPFNNFYAQNLPRILFILLFLHAIFIIFFQKTVVFEIVIALLIASYAGYTFWLLQKKKRVATDATVWFWKLGLGNAFIFAIFFIISHFYSFSKPLVALFFGAFTLAIVFAMFFKIVPFLVWFHLNRKAVFNAPMMHEIIHPKSIRITFYLFLIVEFFFLLSFFISPFFTLASILLFSLFAKIFYHIYKAWHIFLDFSKKSSSFDFTLK